MFYSSQMLPEPLRRFEDREPQDEALRLKTGG